ncbi:MAG: bifunctional oligoribonuclease/PAP phosphatase NrnA [Halorientalis sp.]
MPLAQAGGAASGTAARVREALDPAVAFALEHPLLVAAAGVAVVLLVVGLGYLHWRRRRGPAERFASLLAGHDEVSVLLHPDPDPDAMACAMAVKTLAETAGSDAPMQYAGQIRHQENRAFEALLDLDFDRIDDASDLTAEDVVLVDHNSPRGFEGAERVDPLAVVDHHPGEGTGRSFTDVRPGYGACATILAEYCRELGWETAPPDAEPGGDRVLPTTLATGLLYGILADTKHLTAGCSPAEFRAAEYLYEGVDADLLDRIANPEVDAEVLEVKAAAIERREVRNAFAFSHVGEISNVDALGQAADELRRLEGINAVVVAGEKEGTVHLSGRSRDDRVHMGKALETAVEDVPMASAGGHSRMAGGQLSVEHMEGLGPSGGVTMAALADRVFDAMAGDV